ncbi:MAG: phosphomannomutase/phosphoglucomutase [Planctomycetota bacterium]
MAGIFKAYDIRGVHGKDLDEGMARRIGWAFATFLKAKRVLVGRDVRIAAPAVSAAVIEGIRSTGADVIDVGLVTTPATYFGVGSLGADGGVMVTASHNPPEWIGFKLCREQAIPLSENTGIKDLERMVGSAPSAFPASGRLETRDIREDYVRHLLSFARDVKPLSLVIDTAHGAVGTLLPRVLEKLPCRVERLYFEPDGRFPAHEPNPLKEETLSELKRVLAAKKADLGVGFDGDGDRCIFVDSTGRRVRPDLVTGVLARELLAASPGSAVVYDLRSSWAVREEIEAAGGRAVRERVGHAFIKATMRREKAALGGELSGHYYFRDHYYADSGIMAFLRVLSLVSRAGKPLHELVRPLERYAASGELNFHVEDKDGMLQRLKAEFADGRMDELDGVTVEYPDWWFNARKSNTEPAMRLNVEARTPELLAEGKRRLLGLLGTPEGE